MKIIVADDQSYNAVGTPTAYLQAEHPDRLGRYTFVPLTNPTKIVDTLAEHPDTKAVLVDMDFRITSSSTGLSILDSLASLPQAPPAIGYCAAEESRSLFKYAACQLIERPPLGWVEKNDQDLVELFRLLDEIDKGGRVMTSPSLLRCYPGAPSTGNLMNRILRHPYDARLWDLLATTQLDYDELGTAASIGRSTVRRRLEEYHEAILDFESFQAYERATSADGATAEKPAAAVERGSTPVRRAVGTFARAHSVFFTAVELAGLGPVSKLSPAGGAGVDRAGRVGG